MAQEDMPVQQAPDLKNYSWLGVLAFIQDQCASFEVERTKWLIEKRSLTEQVAKLEGEAQASETALKDLTRRVKMLEFALRQERIKYAKLTGGHHRVNSDIISSLLRKDKPEEAMRTVVSARKTRNHRQMLSKFLQEIGYEDIFALDSQSKQPSQGHHRTSKSYGSPSLTSFLDQVKETDTRKQELVQVEASKVEWGTATTLKSHMDSVRGVYFTAKEGILATASEDCMLKLWDITAYESMSDSSCIEPYLTLRGHTGPVFALTGATVGSEQLLFSAGSEGAIRVWELIPGSDSDMFGPSSEQNWPIGVWLSHTECVWSLAHHPADSLLLSAGADGIVKMWRTMDKSSCIEQMRASRTSANLLQSYTFPASEDTFHTPTACAWVPTELNSFLVGYSSPFLAIFDKETGKPTLMKFSSDSAEGASQVNSLAVSPVSSLAITGHEDKHVRFFDVNSCACVKDLVGHTEAVNAVALDHSSLQVITGGHDGSLRFWDVRTFQCLHEIPVRTR
jgi:striatin 1/3/4